MAIQGSDSVARTMQVGAVRPTLDVVKAPQIPNSGPERETLLAFLDYHRQLLIDKASDLTDEQLHTRLPPSTLTLGGLVNHMALVEDDWFTSDMAGGELGEPWASAPWDDDRDWEFSSAQHVPSDELFTRYRSAIDRSNTVIASIDDLETLSVKTGRDEQRWTLRWILIHMIEETARHCGHADLIRESIDGSVGDFRE